MVSTQIPDKISVRLLPVSSDLQVISYCTKSPPSVEVLCDRLGRESLFVLELLVFENFE